MVENVFPTGTFNGFVGRGFPHFTKPHEAVEHTFKITCAKGQPSPKDLRISEGCLVTKVPGTYFSPPLEFGDHIQIVNEEKVMSQAHFYQLLLEAAESADSCHTLEITVARLPLLSKLDRNSPQIPPGTWADGYNYYAGRLIFFPRASLGVSIKAINNRVLIQSTDNFLQSIGRRIFFVGDRIVTVNGVKCENTAQTKQLILSSLKLYNVVDVVLERPESQLAIKQVQMSLAVILAPQTNRALPKDVLAICRQEVARIKEAERTKKQEKLAPILKEKGSASSRRITIAPKSKKSNIGKEPTNPAMLSNATGLWKNGSEEKKNRNKKKTSQLSAVSRSSSQEASD